MSVRDAAHRRLSVRDFLSRLKAAGLSTLPGTAAEVLDAKRSVTGWLMKEDAAEAGQ